jgi:hypothetical protein
MTLHLPLRKDEWMLWTPEALESLREQIGEELPVTAGDSRLGTATVVDAGEDERGPFIVVEVDPALGVDLASLLDGGSGAVP